MILITGATGTIGSEVLHLLVDRGDEVRAMSANPARIPLLPGVEVVDGNFRDPEILQKATNDIEVLMLLNAPGPWMVEHDRTVLAAARAAGVERVVKLSTMDAEIGDWYQTLQLNEMDLTELRPSALASNTLRWATQLRGRQPVPNMTGAGTQGIVDPRDVAEVAVRALESDGTNKALTLTGPELLSTPDMAMQLGQILGLQVETVDVALDTYRQHMKTAGIHPTVVDAAIRSSDFIANGGAAWLTDDVESVLGRPPRSFATWVQDNRGAFFAD